MDELTLARSMELLQTSEKETSNGLIAAEEFVNRNYLINLSEYPVVPMPEKAKSFLYDKVFEITRIVYDPEEGINDKLVSIYSAIYNMGSSLMIIIDSTSANTRLFIGTRDAENASTAGKLLEKALLGNFPGIGLIPQSGEDVRRLLRNTIPEDYARKSLAAVSVVPSQREEKEQNFIQGIEKFIESMQGETYTAVFIAEPVDKESLLIRKNGYEQLATSMSKFASLQLNFSQSESGAVAEGLTENFSTTVGKSVSQTNTTNDSFSKGTNRGHNRGSSFTIPLVGIGRNSGTSFSKTENYTVSSGKSDTVSTNEGETKSTGLNVSITNTTTNTNAITLTITDRRVQSLTEKIDCHLERIQDCESFGMWDGAAYFISDSREVSIMAANAYKALVSGENTNVENAFVNVWSEDSSCKDITVSALQYIRYGMHPVFVVENNKFPKQIRDIFSKQLVTPASAISGTELPVFLGLPFKSISGVTSLPMAEFGRNVVELGTVEGNRKFKLGCAHHMGIDKENVPVTLKVNTLASHTFITGSSGVGKSNAVYHILKSLYSVQGNDGNSSSVKFLVVEPTKGEYKDFFAGLPNINILTVGQAGYDVLRLNPFAFPDSKMMVLGHIDKLIEIFSACWPLYAAMPAILKSSFEKAYQCKGWDLKNSFYLGTDKNDKYPTFFDVLEQLPLIIDSSEYSAQSKGDYKGALETRVKSLTTGTFGSLFCDKQTVPDNVLFDENTIIDISEVGSTETLSLIMGILVLKLSEYRSANAEWANIPLRHVTVLEEAHNILPRVSTEQGQESGNVQGKSVEMLCNAIAEMRTYGEGFIIADQTPSALAKAAIANTSTKVIMRLADFDDCVAVGKSIGLKEPQIEEIGKLGRGIAVVYQSNWLEAVLTYISKADEVIANFEDFCADRIMKKKQMLGDLIFELVEQKSSGSYDSKPLIGVLDRAERRNSSGSSKTRCISHLEHIRYSMMINDFMKSSDKDRRFPEFVVKLIDCDDIMHTITPNFPERIIQDASAKMPKNAYGIVNKLSTKNRDAARQWYFKIRDIICLYVPYDDKKYVVAQLMFYIHRHTRLHIDGIHYNPNKQELSLHIASMFILSLLFK